MTKLEVFISPINRRLTFWEQKAIGRVIPKSEKSSSRILTGPTFVSWSRIPLSFLIVEMRAKHYPLWSILAVFAVTALTDRLDGAWARREGTTRVGELMDASSDKAFAISIGWSLWGVANKWMLGALGLIELSLCSLAILAYRGNVSIKSNDFGKTKFPLECASIIAFYVGWRSFGDFLVALSIAFAFLSIYAKWEEVKGYVLNLFLK